MGCQPRCLGSAGDLPPELATALVDGTAVGGARPKVLIRDGSTEYIAKLSTSADLFPVVKAEAVCLELARMAGIDVPASRLVRSLGRDVLLVERFDRPGSGRRRLLVSALTLQRFGDFLGARYSSYPEMLEVILQHSVSGEGLAREVFRLIVFNVGNTDDHARNHAAFWDGRHLALAPVYDLSPQLRTARESNQAMYISRSEARSSQFATCVRAAPDYGLSEVEARSIVDDQVANIRANWESVCDRHELRQAERDSLFGSAILNLYAFEGSS